MKKLLNAYYELTIIPAIVLGCITNLGWYAIHFVTEHSAYVTAGEFVFAFVFFFVAMTIEDIIKATLRRIRGDVPRV